MNGRAPGRGRRRHDGQVRAAVGQGGRDDADLQCEECGYRCLLRRARTIFRLPRQPMRRAEVQFKIDEAPSAPPAVPSDTRSSRCWGLEA